MRTGIVLFVLLACAQTAAPQTIYRRPTTVRIMIGGAARDRAGDYTSTGVSSLCGEVPKESSLTGQASFIVEYPGDGKVTTIAFGSNQLVGAVTTANTFRLSVGVINAQGGSPPLFVLNTDTGQKGNSGVATLIKGKTGVTLQVKGENDMRETINLTLTCS
jgi:hypothetical protein